MPDAHHVLNIESLRQALAAQGQSMTEKQARGLAEQIASLGGVALARVAVELLSDVRGAA